MSMLRVAGDRGRICPFSPRTIIRWILPEPGKVGVPSFEVGVFSVTMVLPSLITGVPFDIPVASVDPRTERGEASLGGVPFDLGELPSSCVGGVPLTTLKTAFLNQEHTIMQ